MQRAHDALIRKFGGTAGDEDVSVACWRKQTLYRSGVRHVVKDQEPRVVLLCQEGECLGASVVRLNGFSGRQENFQQRSELGVDRGGVLGADPPDDSVVVEMA